MGSETIVSAGVLRDYVARIHAAAGVPPATAELVADSLVAANLRGVDSHGSQLTVFYVERLLSGDMDPHAEGRIVSESGSTMLYDGEKRHRAAHLGDLLRPRYPHRARAGGGGSERAGVQPLRRGGLLGAEDGRCGADRAGVLQCLHNRAALAGTAGAPGGPTPSAWRRPGPWLLDMATTTVAMNRIYKAQMDGYETIPARLGARFERRRDYRSRCRRERHAHAAGRLQGLRAGDDGGDSLLRAERRRAHREEVAGIHLQGRKSRASQMFMAIDVGRFLPAAEFTERLEHLVGYVKSSRPAPGYDEVLVAGDPEWRVEEARLRDGIPLGQGTWNKLAEVAVRLGGDGYRICRCGTGA